LKKKRALGEQGLCPSDSLKYVL